MKKVFFLIALTFGFVSMDSFAQNNLGKSNSSQVAMVATNIDENNVILTPAPPKKKRNNQNQKQEVVNPYPERVEAYINFEKGNAYYTRGGLNALDSIYLMTFNSSNNRFYKMTIIGYDDGGEITEESSSLARDRAIVVFKYFSSREETEYIIKRTPSTYTQSCVGEINYYIKYKMPFDFQWLNLYNLPEDEKTENGISLASKVHIIIEEDQEDCLGEYYDYDWPAQDTVLSGNHAKVMIPKGTLEYIHHTKDTIPYSCNIEYKEMLSFEKLTSNYSLVPHKKQYIINAGYIVVAPEKKPDYSSCASKDTITPTILISVPIEKQQQAAGLKFYGKTYKPNGEVVYKSISTKKIKDKDTKDVTLECYITPFQFDTIYLGKKVEEKEMGDYFYPAREGEPGAFEAMGGWLKPFKLNKQGDYIIKESMQSILRKPNGSYSAD
ncbi:MAG: hypothetical protein KBT03_10605 [Bacteroidales bacterium]|nr:hypothetical protein [Candidatus Scybalousia scybalohippi]